MAVSTIDALYNGGSEKVTATSTGISVTGTVTADGPLDINAADGVADNAFALRVQNLEATDDRSYGVYIQAGSTSVDSALAIADHTGANSLLWVAGNGNVGISTASPSAPLEASRSDAGIVQYITNTGSNQAYTAYGNSDNPPWSQDFNTAGGLLVGIDSDETGIVYQGGNKALRFGTNAAERMQIDASGNLLVGKTTTALNDAGHLFGEDGYVYHTRTGNIMWLNTLSSSAIAITFAATGTTKGNIVINTSSVSYNTTSDYRLKTDAQPMTGASARVQALNPVNFEWISSGDRVDGFLAHEAQAVVPESVTGTKDAMKDEEYEVTAAVYEDVVIEAVLDDEGNELEAERTEQNLVTEAVMGTRSVPDYQGIDQSKIVPLLTAALQEALTEIAALKARVTTLEG